jgi:hypothetical protein
MTGLSNTIGVLRRRRADLGRLVLILFALASASAGAAPCLAMAVPDSPGAHHSDTHMASLAADSAHDHVHAMEHEHSTPPVDQRDGSHGPCSHCPLAVSMDGSASSSSHAFCSAADDASDTAKPNWSPPALKHVLSTALIRLLPVDPRSSLASARQPPPEAAPPSVALNLRHCVFLI